MIAIKITVDRQSLTNALLTARSLWFEIRQSRRFWLGVNNVRTSRLSAGTSNKQKDAYNLGKIDCFNPERFDFCNLPGEVFKVVPTLRALAYWNKVHRSLTFIIRCPFNNKRRHRSFINTHFKNVILFCLWQTKIVTKWGKLSHPLDTKIETRNSQLHDDGGGSNS